VLFVEDVEGCVILLLAFLGGPYFAVEGVVPEFEVFTGGISMPSKTGCLCKARISHLRSLIR
jgi:hypothetical protein